VSSEKYPGDARHVVRSTSDTSPNLRFAGRRRSLPGSTALYVRVDDELKMHPELGLAVVQADSASARRPGSFASPVDTLFPYVPNQSGYNKRLRAAAAQLKALMSVLAVSSPP